MVDQARHESQPQHLLGCAIQCRLTVHPPAEALPTGRLPTAAKGATALFIPHFAKSA